jgi:hypothetical protein
MTRSSANILELPLEERTQMAPKVAVKKAIAERLCLGLPNYIWRERKVVELSLEEQREL